MPRAALLAGATGLVGGHVLDRLLVSPAHDRVTVLVRRPLDRAHPKLDVRIVDFEALARGEGIDLGAADEAYLCLGTTRRAAGSADRFRRVDHDYSVACARVARDAGARRAGLVSSVGASARAASFYLRVKGETERDVEALGFDALAIARPSFLVGERREHRAGEAIGIAAARAVGWALGGPLRRYRAIEADVVAAGLVTALAEDRPGARVLEHDALVALAEPPATGG